MKTRQSPGQLELDLFGQADTCPADTTKKPHAKSNKVTIGKLNGPRHIGIQKIEAGLQRNGINDNVPTKAHVIDYLEAQGVTMEGLADQDATENVIDLLINLYLNRASLSA